MRLYRIISLLLAVSFAFVGLMFFLAPDRVIIFFNGLAHQFGMTEADPIQGGFYLALAVAYMYVVTLLAVFMYRNPQNRTFPMLLVNAKFASAVISFILFFITGPYLIFLVNGIVDGLIGTGLAIYYPRAIGRSLK
jgi:hypothetical protein